MPRLPTQTPYRYPEHLREQFEGLPRAPGVYLFYGEQQSMPLYIGKSINIRSRVLGHARTRQEARLLHQARRIEYHITAGDLGAQLLEAQLIKRLQPLHNRRLRKQRRLYTIHLHSQATRPLEICLIQPGHDARTACYGLFTSRTAAIQAVSTLADQHELCYQRLGITAWPRSSSCFRVALKRCRGVCCGREHPAAHDTRLQQALEQWRLQAWPYAGPIGIIETSATLRQIHVVHQWHYLGSTTDTHQAQRFMTPVPGFDRDIYRILCPALLGETYPIIPLSC